MGVPPAPYTKNCICLKCLHREATKWLHLPHLPGEPFPVCDECQRGWEAAGYVPEWFPPKES